MHQVNIREQLPKYLDGEVKLLTTQCVVIETEKLGVFGAMFIVKQFGIHKCGHDAKPIPASDCLLSMIGQTNSSRYFLATQDRELQAVAQSIPGTPIIYLHDKTPTLQPPSEMSTKAANIQSKSLFDVRKDEEDRLKTLKRLSGVEEKEEPLKKKRKRRGPNPLSCKKKKKKIDSQNIGSKETKRKRKRKRIRISKHIREQLSKSESIS